MGKENKNLERVIDIKSAGRGESLIQDEWIEYFARMRRNFISFPGSQMISAPDVYNAVKDNPRVLDSLREDFKYRILTSTRNTYDSGISGIIIHDFRTNSPNQIKVAEIPAYQNAPVKEVVEGKGLRYAQALFNTTDSSSKIIDTLEKLSQKGAEEIRFWTPNIDGRKAYPARAVGLGYGYCNCFHINGDLMIEYCVGRSREVIEKMKR